jgi:hypothetical protein
MDKWIDKQMVKPVSEKINRCGTYADYREPKLI